MKPIKDAARVNEVVRALDAADLAAARGEDATALYKTAQDLMQRYEIIEQPPEEPDPTEALIQAGTALGKSREELRQLDSVGKLLEEAKPTEGAKDDG